MSSSLWTTEANGYLTFCVSVAFLYSVIFCFFNCDFLWKTEKLQDFFIIVRRLTNRTTRSMSLPKRPYHQLSVLNGITGRQRRPVKFPTWKSRKQ